jgi:hypothetical protein
MASASMHKRPLLLCQVAIAPAAHLFAIGYSMQICSRSASRYGYQVWLQVPPEALVAKDVMSVADFATNWLSVAKKQPCVTCPLCEGHMHLAGAGSHQITDLHVFKVNFGGNAAIGRTQSCFMTDRSSRRTLYINALSSSFYRLICS